VLSHGKRARLRRQRHRYNATSTYARHSDVPTPYFAGRCRLDPAASDPAPRRRPSIDARLRIKHRAVAWFATHCWTSSRRERYNLVSGQRTFIPHPGDFPPPHKTTIADICPQSVADHLCYAKRR